MRKASGALASKTEWLVPGLIRRGGIVLISGPAASGKSSAAAGLALAAAAGGRWLGMPVSPGDTLYLGCEAPRALPRRLADLPNLLHPVVYLPSKVNLAAANAFNAVMKQVSQAHGPSGEDVSLIIVDPLSYSVGEGDLNDNMVAGKALQTISDVAGRLGATAIVTVCQPHALRGPTAAMAAAETVLSASRKGDVVTIHVAKQRDAEALGPFKFSLTGSPGCEAKMKPAFLTSSGVDE